jgi:hypothetical protein
VCNCENNENIGSISESQLNPESHANLDTTAADPTAPEFGMVMTAQKCEDGYSQQNKGCQRTQQAEVTTWIEAKSNEKMPILRFERASSHLQR